MKIYTKTGTTSMYFNGRIVDRITTKQATKQRFNQGSVFWYDQHDGSVNELPFNEFLDNRVAKHLRRDPTSKILLFYGDEYINKFDINCICSSLKEKQISPKQFYLICTDENFKNWAIDLFNKLGCNGVNVTDLNVLLQRVDIPDLKPSKIQNRFNAFSRNYLDWRLQFFCELIDRDVLKNFDYTFNNITPYAPVKTYSHKEILTHATEMGYSHTPELLKWVERIPYTLEGTWKEKMPTEIYQKIASSDISVIIESHFDPLWNGKERFGIHWKELSPAFPTEKTYKAIGMTKPFIIVSTPEFLKEFKQMGYKTFHPYIDETYDTIENNNDRMKAITSEIQRLSNLSDQEFAAVVTKCKKIAEHNAQVMRTKQATYSCPPEFKWVEEIMTNTFAKPRVI